MKKEKIATTLYINTILLEKIKISAQQKNISYGEMICKILKSTKLNENEKLKLYKPVRYQHKDPSKQWKTFHVRFNSEDYEFFTDKRKLFKVSVSLQLFLAATKYLDSQNKEDDFVDNYFMFFHKIEGFRQNNTYIWKIYWKKQKKHNKLLE